MLTIEDSLKGVLTTIAIIALFSTSILNYILVAPIEQGIFFTDAASNNAYTVIQNNTDVGSQATLTTLNNNSQTAFNQWDITVGFMGSNAVKQTSATGVSGYGRNLFSQIILIGTLIFNSGSPIVYALTTISLLSIGWITYVVIAFIRSGR